MFIKGAATLTAHSIHETGWTGLTQLTVLKQNVGLTQLTVLKQHVGLAQLTVLKQHIGLA